MIDQQVGFRGTWNSKELRSALRLAQQRYWLLMFVAVTPMTVLLVFDIGVPDSPVEALLILTPSAGIYLINLRRTRSTLKAAWFQGSVDGFYSANGIVVNASASTAEFGWSTFSEVRHNAVAALLVRPNKSSQFVLRNWFESDSEWQRFLTFATEAITAGTNEQTRFAAAGQSTSSTGEMSDLKNGPPFLVSATMSDLDPSTIAFSGALGDLDLGRLTRQLNPRRETGHRFIGIAVVFILVVWLLLRTNPTAAPVLLPFAFLSLVMPVHLMVVTPWLWARGLQKAGSAIRTGVVSNDGIQFQVDDIATAIPWVSFERALVNDETVGLMVLNSSMLIFHRAWFESTDHWLRFKGHVAAQVVDRPRNPPTI